MLTRVPHLGIFLALLTLFSPAALSANDHWNYEETRSDTRDFVASGTLHVHMGVGDLHIKRGDSNQVALRYTLKSSREKNLKDSYVDFTVHGSDANIQFNAPLGNTAFDVELEVPAKTNLDLHEKVGDMVVDDIEGDKDLELGVGDIHVAGGRSGYHLVRASTGIGDVNSDGYGEANGWLGKTLKYQGEGRYELRAHVGVGDIRLERK